MGIAKTKKEKRDRKLNVEIAGANFGRMREYIKEYNEDPKRLTPEIRNSHVVNMALHNFLKSKVD